MLHTTLVNAIDLTSWSNRNTSKIELPLLVRKLIQATVSEIGHIDIRTGEGTAIGGWDGVLEVSKGNEYIPDGKSVWEFGTNKKQRTKADEDYEKRKADPGDGIVPSETTYVYVNSRRWNSNWGAEKKKEGFWKDVKVYDADDLHAWLEKAPAVHIWITLRTGKRPESAVDLKHFSTQWSAASNPPMRSEIVLSGRDDSLDLLTKWMNGPASMFSLNADSREEALIFLYATIETLPGISREALLSRATVVESLNAWRELALSKTPLLLIPMFDPRTEVASAATSGHHVFVPLGGGENASAKRLPRLKANEARKILQEMGIDENRSGDLAVLGRRSLLALRRRLALNKDLHIPPWATSDEVRKLIPFLFAGKWYGSNGADRTILERLSGTTYDQLNDTLSKLLNAVDPPIRRVGDLFFISSNEDLWELVSSYITRDDLVRLMDTVKEVFGSPDPNESLTPAEKLAAVLARDVNPSVSGRLKAGLMETVALMAARSGSNIWQDPQSGQDWADRIIYSVFDGVNAEPQSWRSIAPQLQLIAEASPNLVLQMVENSLQDENPAVLGMFDEGEDSIFGENSAHTYLLWTLEMLAWNPEYLSNAALALARLTRLDPGGRLGNRPRNSLWEIFLGWNPQTNADVGTRLKVIDRIRKKESDVAWQLMFDILPERHNSSTPTAEPRFRDWETNSRHAVTYAELGQLAAQLVNRLVEDAGWAYERWGLLIGTLENLTDDLKEIIRARLAGLEPDRFDAAGRNEIWKILRSAIYRHRQYSDTNWAMAPGFVDRLEDLYNAFVPPDSIDKFAYLFERGVEVLNPPDRKTEKPGSVNLIVDTMREAALEELDNEGGLARLLEAAERFSFPVEYGFAVGKLEKFEKYDEELPARYLISVNERLNQFTQGFVRGIYIRKGWEWAKNVLDKNADAWSSKQKAAFLANTEFSERVWDLIESIGADADSFYWKQIVPGYAGAVDFERVARKLNANQRPHFAADFLSLYLHDVTVNVPPRLALDTLEKLIKTTTELGLNWSGIGYAITKLLEVAQSDASLDETRIAALEWILTPIVDGYGGKPVVLHRELGRNPEHFCELIRILYRSDKEKEERKFNAGLHRAAWALKQSWHVCPGITDDATLDRDDLRSWVDTAGKLLDASGHSEIGHNQIGEALAESPHGADGGFPHEFVREIIEDMENLHLERGFETRVFNNRGTTVRGLMDGGAQERVLAERYEGYAKKSDGEYPRTAAMLRRLSAGYEADAKREDASAELTEDFAN